MKYQPLKTLTGMALAAAFLASAALPASAAEYKIDPTHSFIEFKTKHLGFSGTSTCAAPTSSTLRNTPRPPSSAPASRAMKTAAPSPAI